MTRQNSGHRRSARATSSPRCTTSPRTPTPHLMSYLKTILDHKRGEIAELKSSPRALAALRSEAADRPAPRGFRKALLAEAPPRLIAECKKASPSKGLLRPDYDAVAIARRYEETGAACLSVLTDVKFFQGSLDDLRRVRTAVQIPLLRKDFMLDAVQLVEARAAGADCILLIAAALSRAHYEDLAHATAETGMDALVELHDEADLELVYGSAIPPVLVGVNNRNLSNFVTDLATTERLAPIIFRHAPEAVLVGESGIETRAHVERLARCGARAVLVGETLVRKSDPGLAVIDLLAKSLEPTSAKVQLR